MVYKKIRQGETEWISLPGSISEEAGEFESRSPSAGTRDGSQS